jgi:transposase-like protein
MNQKTICPQYGSVRYRRNGRTHTGKPTHRCKDCGRQFVLNAENRLISDTDRALVKRLLAERLSVRGICRAVQVSLGWLVLERLTGCLTTTMRFSKSPATAGGHRGRSRPDRYLK